MKILLLALLVVPWISCPSLAHEIRINMEYPEVGAPVEVFVKGQGLDKTSLFVKHRPGSETEEELLIGRLDDSNKMEWIPKDAGIARLVLRDDKGGDLASKNTAICYSGIPILGVGVMVLAGILLFGGAAISLSIALQEKLD